MKNSIKKVLSYLLLNILTIIIFMPFLWMFFSSLKEPAKIFEYPPRLIPNPIVFQNYIEIFKVQPNFPRYYLNSTYTSVVATVGTLLVASLAGYAFAKIKFPAKNIIFLILLSSMMIPHEATAIPMFTWMTALKMTNTHWPLIIPPILGGGGIFGLFMMRQYFITVPNDMDHAAKIDGCTPWMTYRLIMLPIAVPTIASLGLVTFLVRWNDFFDPLIYLSNNKLFTIPLALAMFTDSNGTAWHLIMVASVLATIPLLLIFFFAQKQFIDSIALSGIK